MIIFSSMVGDVAKKLVHTLEYRSPTTSLHLTSEEGSNTYTVEIITYLPVTIGPEDIIIIPPEGDPIVIAKVSFHTMEVY